MLHEGCIGASSLVTIFSIVQLHSHSIRYPQMYLLSAQRMCTRFRDGKAKRLSIPLGSFASLSTRVRVPKSKGP